MKVASTVRGGAVRKGLQMRYLACRLLYTRIDGRNPDAPICSLSSGAKGKDVDMFGVGRWKELSTVLKKARQ